MSWDDKEKRGEVTDAVHNIIHELNQSLSNVSV